MRILSDIGKWRNAVAENATLKALLAQAKAVLDGRAAIILEQVEEIGKLRADRALMNELRDRDEKAIADLRSQFADRARMANHLEDQLMELAAERDRIAGDREALRRKLTGEAAGLRQELLAALTDAEKYRAHRAKDRARLRKRTAARNAA